MPGDAERACAFASPGPLRDRLVAAVLRSEKTATSSLLVEWELERAALPSRGERQTVVSDGRPVGVIDILAVDVIRLGDAGPHLARAEGEAATPSRPGGRSTSASGPRRSSPSSARGPRAR